MSFALPRDSGKLEEGLSDERPPVELVFGLPKRQVYLFGGVVLLLVVGGFIAFATNDLHVICPEDGSCPYFPGSRMVDAAQGETLNAWVAAAEAERGRWRDIELNNTALQDLCSGTATEVPASCELRQYTDQISCENVDCSREARENGRPWPSNDPRFEKCTWTPAHTPECNRGWDGTAACPAGCTVTPINPLAGVGTATWTLCYSSIRDDGQEATDFHTACDGYTRTLTLAAIGSGDVRFGGYVRHTSPLPARAASFAVPPTRASAHRCCAQASASWNYEECCRVGAPNSCPGNGMCIDATAKSNFIFSISPEMAAYGPEEDASTLQMMKPALWPVCTQHSMPGFCI
jgi:hypothetical protein